MSEAAAVDHGLVESLVAQVTDDFMERLSAGEQPNIEDYADRYPQIAPVLRQVLPALELLRVAVPNSLAPPGAAASSPELAGTLGDFRLLREIGRGGMGIVYEAEQISLGRRVALKVLPFAATMDPKHLQRFKNEAQAAAQLHHTNIVPVFGVGCERGVHYYAMQFIEGQTLAAVIAELRQHTGLEQSDPRHPLSEVASDLVSGGLAPVKRATSNGPPATPYEAPTPASAPLGQTVVGADLRTDSSIKSRAYFRSVADLGLQAAEALEHAHQLGVVHRDIKPANLLVDVRGNLWITDFGLAHFQSNPGLTLSGDLMGTIRYMSPEQAMARRVLIDHRTDLYSLGVTLYELLTLEPAFAGNDRQELLRRIASEEPHLPRRLNKPIPAELETIVLKAMEKNPAERYTTAQELADDLGRFLEDKPIRAKRPTLAQRAAKWSRRHRSVVASAGILVLLSLIGLMASTVLIWREKEQTRAALADAKANAQTADANYQRAQENLNTAYRILDEIYLDTTEKRLPQQTVITREDRQFLDKALTFYEHFAHQNSNDPNVRQKTAEGYLRVGTIKERLGQGAQAEAANRQALSVATKLVAEFPDRPDYRQCLARSYCSLGGMDGTDQVRLGRLPEVERAYAEALRILEQLVTEFPANLDYQHDLGLTYFWLGFWRLMCSWQSRAVPDPEEPIRRALAIRDKLVKEKPTLFLYRKEQAMSLGNLGNVLAQANRRQETEEVLQRELAVRQKLVEDFPGEPEARFYLADAYMDLGNWREHTGKFAEAEEALRRRLSLLRQLAAELPSAFAHQHSLTWSSCDLGDFLREKGAQGDAVAAYQVAVVASREVIRLKPESAWGHYYLARALAGTGARKEASAAWKQAVKLSGEDTGVLSSMAWFLATSPDPANQNPELAVLLGQKAVALAPERGDYWSTLGTAYYRWRQWKDAVAAFDKTRQLQSAGNDWFFLAMAHWQLGDREKARHWYECAVQRMDKSRPWDAELRRFRTEAAALLGLPK
ncbi:MAG TPA: protein kinase [Gemmataceae bacterium]|nr:protein kinase [Gemmataceae bacterium]